LTEIHLLEKALYIVTRKVKDSFRLYFESWEDTGNNFLLPLKQHIFYIASKDANAREFKKKSSLDDYEKLLHKIYQAVIHRPSLALAYKIGEILVGTPTLSWFKSATSSVVQEQTSWLMDKTQQNVSFHSDSCFSLQSTISESSSAEMYFNFWKHAIEDEQIEATGKSFFFCATLLRLRGTSHTTTLTFMMQDDLNEDEDTELLCERLFPYSEIRLWDEPSLKEVCLKDDAVIRWLEERQSMMLRTSMYPKCGPKVSFTCFKYTSKFFYT
jgi:hypothetical protein